MRNSTLRGGSSLAPDPLAEVPGQSILASIRRGLPRGGGL